jgi:hypothetical protein
VSARRSGRVFAGAVAGIVAGIVLTALALVVAVAVGPPRLAQARPGRSDEPAAPPLKPTPLACPVTKGQVAINGVRLPVPPGPTAVTAEAPASYVLHLGPVARKDAAAAVQAQTRFFTGKVVQRAALGAFSLEANDSRVVWFAAGRTGTAGKTRWFWVRIWAPGQLVRGEAAFREDPTTLTVEVAYGEGDAKTAPGSPRCGP